MTEKCTEVPLVSGVYLRTETNDGYSLRPGNCLSTFPISGGTYFGNELDNPQEDLIQLLWVQAKPYKGLQTVIESVYEVVHPPERKSHRILEEVVGKSKQLFFSEQISRLSLVEQALRERVEKAKLDNRHIENFPGHYLTDDFFKIYNFVVSLHRAVQNAESSFNKLVIGTGFTSEDKYGAEPYVKPPLELATDRLSYLSSKPEGKKLFEEVRKELLLGQIRNAEETHSKMRKSLL